MYSSGTLPYVQLGDHVLTRAIWGHCVWTLQNTLQRTQKMNPFDILGVISEVKISKGLAQLYIQAARENKSGTLENSGGIFRIPASYFFPPLIFRLLF